MARIFTITEGLENLGALKTGGQGSVYKGRRADGSLTAIKLLPTPIFHESNEDKAYRDFNNEVEKLQRVNKEMNPHVVRILSWGVTDTGNFPFIEMPFIEGPDLEELLTPPHNKIFTLAEAIKVAEHLSNALAHCHAVNVKHGDVKSNNVKFNLQTGNYILLDFGLAVLSDEQRRTSLRQAGAIEFMAPEQSEGKLFFASDVYSFGIILFELLAGVVPFPLKEKNESARNRIMLAHLEKSPPDVIKLRRQNLPDNWSDEEKEKEMQVPAWLLAVIDRCLQKNHTQRYATGEELYKEIKQCLNGVAPAAFNWSALPEQLESDGWLQEKKELQQQLHQQQKELHSLRELVVNKEGELTELRRRQPYVVAGPTGFSSGAFYTVLFFAAVLAAFAGYLFFENKMNVADVSDKSQNEFVDTALQNRTAINEPQQTTTEDPVVVLPQVKDTTPATIITEPATDPMQFDTAAKNSDGESAQPQANNSPTTGTVQYTVKSRAYFHDEPVETTRRNAYIVIENNALLTPLDEKDGFVYVVYTNAAGQVSRGWLMKKDLEVRE